MPQHLDLDDTEADALATRLTHAIDGDRYPLSWSELQEAAAEVGGSLRALFSFKH